MAEFARHCAGQVEIKKMSMPEDDLEIAPEKIKHEDVAEKMPRAEMQEGGGNELPGVSVSNTAIANAEKLSHKTGLVCFEQQLADKRCEVETDQGDENDARLMRPA